MQSIRFFVIDGSIHINFPDEIIKKDIIQRFEFERISGDSYVISNQADIRPYLEKELYPYAVYVGRSEPPSSRTWIPPSEEKLTTVSGVGLGKAEKLNRFGIVTIDDLKSESQSNLARIDGIGMALAARIKADVGDLI